MNRHYVGLWLILAVALLIFTLVSLAGEFSIFGYQPRKSEIGSTLRPKPEVPDLQQQLAENRAAAAEAEDKEVCDSTNQVILIIGDSMTWNLALRLNEYAAQNGHTLYAVNWDSSNTVTWSKSDRLDKLIEEYQPTQVFISLGANELLLTKPEMRRPNVETILAKIGDIPHVWIGPPNWKADAGLNDMLEAVNPPGTYFRSEGMEFERRSDKIHPTQRSSALWMDSVMRWLPKSTHPFLAEPPQDGLKAPKLNLIYLKSTDK